MTTSTQVLSYQTPVHGLDEHESSKQNVTNTVTFGQQNLAHSQGPALKVDFTWKKWHAKISAEGDSTAKTLYVLDYKTFKPHLVLKSASDDTTTIGTGSLHPVSINADCEVHGKTMELVAMKRFQTEYQHLSYAYSDSDGPVPLTWTSASGWRHWDFICLDQQQNPVAKVSGNCWSLNNIGRIEFLGSKSNDKAAREEIIVVGLTLYYCMVLRVSNIFSLAGAIFAKPGHGKTQ